MDHFKLLQHHIRILSNHAHFMGARAQAVSDIIQAGGRVDFSGSNNVAYVNVKLGEHQMGFTGHEGEHVWPVFLRAMKLAIRDAEVAEIWTNTLQAEYGENAVTNTGIHDRLAGYCIEVMPDWFTGHFSILPRTIEVWGWKADGQSKFTPDPIITNSIDDIIDYIESFKGEK